MAGTSPPPFCVLLTILSKDIFGHGAGRAWVWGWRGPDSAWTIGIYVTMEFHFSWYLVSYQILMYFWCHFPRLSSAPCASWRLVWLPMSNWPSPPSSLTPSTPDYMNFYRSTVPTTHSRIAFYVCLPLNRSTSSLQSWTTSYLKTDRTLLYPYHHLSSFSSSYLFKGTG